eukprot:7530399-Pyramimonas_sp.AAC.1
MGALLGPVANSLDAQELAHEEPPRPVPCLYGSMGSAAQLARKLLAHAIGPRTWIHDDAEPIRGELGATAMHLRGVPVY